MHSAWPGSFGSSGSSTKPSTSPQNTEIAWGLRLSKDVWEIRAVMGQSSWPHGTASTTFQAGTAPLMALTDRPSVIDTPVERFVVHLGLEIVGV